MLWLENEPNTTIAKLLREEWGMAEIEGYDPQAITHFQPDTWIHTGWYNDGNPNPQISVSTNGNTTVREGLRPEGVSRLKETNVSCVIWPPKDDDLIGGQNLKEYVYQMTTEAERILFNKDTGYEDLSWIVTGDSSKVSEPDETPLPYHWEIPVACGWEQTKQ